MQLQHLMLVESLAVLAAAMVVNEWVVVVSE